MAENVAARSRVPVRIRPLNPGAGSWLCPDFKAVRLALRGAIGSQRDPSHQIRTLPGRFAA